MHNIALFRTRVGLSVICLHPVSWVYIQSIDLYCSEVNQILHRNHQTHHGSDLGNNIYKLKKHFSPCEQIQNTKQLSKVQISSLLISGTCSL